jgi:hypothetical protein
MCSEIERIVTLENKMEDIRGNGKPGRVGKLEERVLLHDRYLLIGFGAVLAAQFLGANGLLSLHLVK